MKFFVNLSKLLVCYVGIYLCCLNIGMAEHDLHASDVGAVFEHERGARVAEQMAATAGDAGGADVLRDQPREVIGAHGAVAVAA